jgi:hypothetical protein
MKWLNCTKIRIVLVGFVAAVVLCGGSAKADNINQAPIADAGLPRYAATDPVVLDGTASYDPDNSGPLSYTWRQIAGPSVEATDTDTATPTISGFTQTDEIQECEFELIVSNGEYDSLSDTVRVVVVPYFGESNLRLENKSFDPKKPTTIYFGGGNCTIGHTGQYISVPDVLSRVNMIDFPHGYTPDSGGGALTYYKYGDMIIAYLSSVAPDYKQPIQSGGFSTGGMPAIDVGIRLNQTYRDARYAVNQVTFTDATPVCRDYSASISTFLGSSVDGEQCWVDNYVNNSTRVHPGVLNVRLSLSHVGVNAWYGNSGTGNDMNQFNNGIVAGAYWSATGPGKNLQLGPAPGATYAFQWHGSTTSGYMDFFDESSYPGRLPEPVTLVGPVDVGDPNGAVLTCEESENAIGYQLLFGPDPYRVMDYNIISDTPTPPNEVITTLPFKETWWTVRAYDQYGSTIYADPICTNAFSLSLPVENLTKEKRYSCIQFAIYDAVNGDEIVLSEGIYEEDIDFKGKNLMIRSTNPNDPATVAATVINGGDQGTVVTLSGSRDGVCVLAGLTITGGEVGISWYDVSPIIRNCTIGSNGPNAIEFWEGYEPPTIIDCTILGEVVEMYEPTLVAYWALDEEEGTVAYDSVGTCDGKLLGAPLWQPAGGKLAGALEFDGIDDYVSTPFVLNPGEVLFSVTAWIKGGAPGQVIISQADILIDTPVGSSTNPGSTWLGINSSDGTLMTGLSDIHFGPLESELVVTDGQWHHVGLVYDRTAMKRHLYVDSTKVAIDSGYVAGLSCDAGLYIGAGQALDATTFFFGLIDDVRIYNRVVRP